MRTVRATFEQYLRAALRLLPPGAFSGVLAQAGGLFRALFSGLAEEWARAHNRIIAVFDEMLPQTALETLAAWEDMLGLPDPGSTLPESDEDRQALVVAKLRAGGPNSPHRFYLLAQALGVTPEIAAPYEPMRPDCGFPMDLYPAYGNAWKFVWTFTQAAMGAPAQALYEATIERYAAAYAQTDFIYEE